MSDLLDLATSLQNDLAYVDLIARPSRSPRVSTEYLIAKRGNLKLKVYREAGLAHFQPSMTAQ